MKKTLVCLFLSFYAHSEVATLAKGTISEKVSTGSIYGKLVVAEINKSDDSDLPSPHHTVIYFTGFESSVPSAAPMIVDQKDKNFDPVVFPIVKGQVVTFLNRDVAVHNVFSMSQAKQFDLGEVSNGGSSKVTFDKTGIVDLYCNIHPKMVGTILVLPNDRFARPESNGTYEITNIMAGTYNVFAWHRRASPQKKSITIKAGERLEVNWDIQLTSKVTSHLNKEGKEYKVHKDSSSSEY